MSTTRIETLECLNDQDQDAILAVDDAITELTGVIADRYSE